MYIESQGNQQTVKECIDWVESMGKNLFILAHEMKDGRFYPVYKTLLKNQWKEYVELKKAQDKKLRKMIKFAYDKVPYYHNLFRKLNLRPDDILNVEDLEKLPILTKDTIKQHWDDFKPLNLEKIKYYDMATGGSTGIPLRYRLEKMDKTLGNALMYRGWNYGGYNLGDKIVFLAGASLNIGTGSLVKDKIYEIAMNARFLSSFDMGEKEMRSYVNTINSFRPPFIRGYASSVYFFARWIEQNDLRIHKPRSVFTTAEKLFPEMRETIENVFGCEVYDGYGLNDGGVSACECSEHCGLHIDTERSVMEVVDPKGDQLEEGEGRIIATSLSNYAMPFIRYDTGDLGRITDDPCPCGRGYKLLREVIGRSVDLLITPEGKMIHGEFISHIFWEMEGVSEFQVVQDRAEEITIYIVPDEGFDEAQLGRLLGYIMARSPDWKVNIRMIDRIRRTAAGKYKFVINNMLKHPGGG